MRSSTNWVIFTEYIFLSLSCCQRLFCNLWWNNVLHWSSALPQPPVSVDCIYFVSCRSSDFIYFLKHMIHKRQSSTVYCWSSYTGFRYNTSHFYTIISCTDCEPFNIISLTYQFSPLDHQTSTSNPLWLHFSLVVFMISQSVSELEHQCLRLIKFCSRRSASC